MNAFSFISDYYSRGFYASKVWKNDEQDLIHEYHQIPEQKLEHIKGFVVGIIGHKQWQIVRWFLSFC